MTDKNGDGTNKPNDGPGSTTQSDIFHVGVRIPTFWPEKPALWFAQVEGNFALSKITKDETKFNYVISQLDQRYAAEVEDIIVAPPKENLYETLKTQLIKRLSASREKEIQQLLMREEMGDRRPSQFLRYLRKLAGPGVPEDFLKSIWTGRLPTHVQTALASQPSSTLDSLADLADTVMDMVSTNPHVAATSTTAGSPFDLMAKQIAALTKQVEALSLNHVPRRSRSKTRNNAASRRERSESSYRKFPICWFHAKFGKKAAKCAKPCDYKKENFQGSL
ncbi:hypothetical protein O0L34_g17455 [Tuta absoluta]|nr:hypothetical protein O0L34_g17455 [Tuta absoluta]